MSSQQFQNGDRVRVNAWYPPGHVRTPHFIRGCNGTVIGYVGSHANPEALAYGRNGEPKQPLYRVQFNQRDVWSDYDGPEHDTLVVDIYEHWLEPDT